MYTHIEKHTQGFIQFIREQGVVGLAIGFVLGAAIGKVVSSFVQDVINPLIGLLWSSSDGLVGLTVGPVHLGTFFAALIDFVIISAVVYFGFKGLGLHKLDKKKEK